MISALAWAALLGKGYCRDLFVVCQDDARLARLDTVNGAVTARIPLSRGPAMIVATRDGQTIYITHPDLGVITRLGGADFETTQTFRHEGMPFGIAADPSGRFIYVGDWKKNAVVRRDARSGAALDEVAVGREPAGIALDAQGRRLFVANRDSRSVSVVDTQSMRVTTELAAGDGPFALALD